MSKRKRKRTRKQQSRRARNRANAKGLALKVTWLEIAKGHDGLFRGDPDPAILIGCYAIVDGAPTLLGRLLQRVQVGSPYPGARDIVDPVVLKRPAPDATELIVLAIALEEDAGDDVRRLYGKLERPDFAVWSDQDEDPAPRTLDELGVAAPAPVHLLVGGRDQRDACADDKWVGAGVCVINRPRGMKARESLRFHFLSPEERNDWTAEVVVSIG